MNVSMQKHKEDFTKPGLWLYKFNSHNLKDYIPDLRERLEMMDMAEQKVGQTTVPYLAIVLM